MGALVGLFLFGIPAAVIANAKGFKPLRWLIALGLIGLITVAVKGSARSEGLTEEERQQRAASANRTGAIMAGISVGLSVVFLVISLAANA